MLMQTMARAWRYRREAALRLSRREYAKASSAARSANALHATRHGRRLSCLAELMRAAAQREAVG